MYRAMRVVVVAALALGFGGIARAQSASAQADALFKRGKDLEAAGKLADACTAFEGSQKLDPAVTTMLNLADCRERNGQLATAYGIYGEVERQLRTAPGGQQALAKTATARAAKLEPRLSKLTLNVAHVSGGETVARGDVAVDQAVWGQALPVDGGTYTITARAPGQLPFTTTVTLANEGEAKAIDVPALAPDPKAAVAITTPDKPVRVAPPLEPAAPHRSGHKALGITLVVAGGAAIAGGLVFGKLAMDKWSDAKDLCGSGSSCNMPGNEAAANKDVDSSHTRGWVATGLAGAGVISAGIGVFFLVRGGGSSSPDEHAHLVPLLSPTSAGLAIGGSL